MNWTLTDLPIIQGPMAGGFTTAELISEVSECGGLGSIGAGYMSPEALRSLIRAVKARTQKPFSVNLFIPHPVQVETAQVEKMKEWLAPYYKELGMSEVPGLKFDPQLFEKQWDVVLQEKVPAFSFTFGHLNPQQMQALKSQGVYIMGTATTLAEALVLQEQGCDAVVAQGAEAGGHRGSFLGDTFQFIPTEELVRTLAGNLKIPVIAAGGIFNRQGLERVTAVGAAAVQIGTAFLVCDESGASCEYKQALLAATPQQSEMIKVFTGRWARGLTNRFTAEMKKHEEEIPAYPIQHWLTTPLRKRAQELGQTDFQSLWAGQGLGSLQPCSAREFMKKLATPL
ncbi:nitronate monooxygenase [Bdellovibrio bacteriovorus]|uniref:NAD(P)H-dependent flavin oxidoreductase n=1 Tax=Bdellovibrio bacteriovorus TaxID=959 RepID=UPI0021D22E06|nr:nitronate monooxygenase [Bdellovibrio bacteriovorus]UXR64891.1 nitronate monooxygenase [Bdellovibrio bacteriovorus]